MMGLFNIWSTINSGGLGLFEAAEAASLPLRILSASLITLAFTAAARALRGVSRSGALAGAVIAFVLYLGAGLGAFVLLVSVFVLTLIATRFGLRKKQARGTAEDHDGRTASQVIANLGPAALAAVLYAARGDAAYLVAVVAALAEAAADTVSSECGQAASATARLISNWKPVPAGTDGGITVVGSAAGAAAGVLVGLAAVAVRMSSWTWFPITVGSAMAGMFLDSLLGATLERHRILDNDGVNLSSNLAAAILALLLVRAYA
jgi:uncharacterized protein (TIGR00297 family)